MDKIKAGFKKLWEWFKALGRGLKIAIVVALVTFVIAMISLFFYSASNKYQVLFSGLDPNDAQLVTEKLNEQKIDTKIEGNSILVPKEMVDELRLSLAPELSTGSKGYELMDNASSFGLTDEEFKLKKLRMQQGELEKTIRSFPQIENVRVHITPSKDSVFVEDKEPGKAAVYVQLNPGNKLTTEQVKSIVALVSGSTENVPKENIEVVDDKMNLLTKDINNEDGTTLSAEAVETQRNLEKTYEDKLTKSIIELLEPVLGKNKVQATVNVDLDFDSKQKTETIIDPNKVIVSQETIRENNNASGTGSQSPVDNNMSNNIEENINGATSSREENRTNYESSKTENKVISAPGEVKRLTTSVIVDGNLNPELQRAIENSVATAIGLDTARGDELTVVGITYDPTTKEQALKEQEALNELLNGKDNKMMTYLILAIAGVGLIILILVIFRRRKNKQEAENDEESLLDVVIDDKISRINSEPLKPIDFGLSNPKAHMEDEIKKYATDKPEQVVDIIKSWLAESER